MSNPESPSDYSILYQRAREEWDERLGSIVKQAHNWKMCAFFSMFIAAIAVGSTGYIGAQSKIEPYVIGVKNGEEVVGVASVQKLPTS
ncbi:VirB8/TrbF family protein, partial [Vibrio parahaemolyticus]